MKYYNLITFLIFIVILLFLAVPFYTWDCGRYSKHWLFKFNYAPARCITDPINNLYIKLKKMKEHKHQFKYNGGLEMKCSKCPYCIGFNQVSNPYQDEIWEAEK